jgi:hypothetical protein
MAHNVNNAAYRTIHSRNEILRLICDTYPLQGGCFWQSTLEGRVTYEIISLKDDYIKETIVFDVSGDIKKTKDPLYCWIREKSLLLKITPDQYQIKRGQVHLKYPTEAKVVEMRGAERISIPKKCDIIISMTSISKGSAIGIRANLADFSEGGLSITTPDVNKTYYARNNEFRIDKLNDEALENPVVATVKHVSSFPSTPSQVKVGLHIDQIMMKNLIDKIQLCLSEKLDSV